MLPEHCDIFFITINFEIEKQKIKIEQVLEKKVFRYFTTNFNVFVKHQIQINNYNSFYFNTDKIDALMILN